MLKNLLETWAGLAPDELSIAGEGGYTFEKTVSWDIYPEIISIHASFLEEASTLDSLQGYIQRCIDARGWGFIVKSDALENTEDRKVMVEVYEVKNEIYGEGEKESILIALLVAYLTALAAQRSITPGRWQHFKGGVIDILVCCEWEKGLLDRRGKAVEFLAEECNEFLTPLRVDENKEIWKYSAKRNMGSRVFYSHPGGADASWARKAENFLGIVGPDHPEHEGKLRFVKVA